MNDKSCSEVKKETTIILMTAVFTLNSELVAFASVWNNGRHIMWRYMNDSYWCIDTGWNRDRDQEHFTLHPKKPKRRPGPDVNPLLWSRSLSRFHWVWINQQCWLYNVLTSRRAAASAPCFNSSLTHSTWLFAAAKTRGVVPSWNRSQLNIPFSVIGHLNFTVLQLW